MLASASLCSRRWFRGFRNSFAFHRRGCGHFLLDFGNEVLGGDFLFIISSLRLILKLLELLRQILLARSATLRMMRESCSGRNQATDDDILL